MKSFKMNPVTKKDIIILLLPILFFHIYVLYYNYILFTPVTKSIADINYDTMQYLSGEFDFKLTDRVKPVEVFYYYGWEYIVLEINGNYESIKDTLIDVINIPEDDPFYAFNIRSHSDRVMLSNKEEIPATFIKESNQVSAFFYIFENKNYVQIKKTGGAITNRERYDAILYG